MTRAERADLADMRFFAWKTPQKSERFRWLVMDRKREEGDKVVGKFKTEANANLFLRAIIAKYIEDPEFAERWNREATLC